MKKTVTVNISGIIFHIDEDAYDRLSTYLDTIRGYFSASDGKEEIISDIEARIAEMLHAKVSETKQVITIEDVNEVISVMGEPEQVAGDEGIDTKSKKHSSRGSRSKRLFRDPDNKVLGGVCSGIAAYFNTDPVWVRLGFVAALLVFGTGPLLYIILWIVIPKAYTTAEKLEMKGEPVTVENIQKTINEEFDNLKDKFKDLKNDAKEAYHKKKADIPRNVPERILDFCFHLLKIFVKIIAIIIGVIFIVVGIFLITGFIASFFTSGETLFVSSMGISNFSMPLFMKLFFSSSTQITIAMVGISLLIGIPLIMLIYNGVKLIFGFKTRMRYVGISTFSLWLAGLILCGIVTFQILQNFNQKVVITKKDNINQPYGRMLYLDVKSNDTLDTYIAKEGKYMIGSWNLVSINNKACRFGIPELEIVKSDNDSTQLLTFFSARGSSRTEANNRAEKLIYKCMIKDTAVVFDSYFKLPENEKWRSQRIHMVLKLPIGKTINVSRNMNRILASVNENGEYERDLCNKKWIMREDGLKEFNPVYIIPAKDSVVVKKTK
jgi:phage shock protein PspC (stress-responsive transcriptional regulator)